MIEQTDSLIKIRNLSFKRQSHLIFSDLNIDIFRGKVTAIMGPSGCGKTTLLQLIGGQLQPSTGIVEMDGQNIHRLNRRELYLMRRKIGMLFQTGALFTNLSVYENVAFPLREQTNLPEFLIRPLVLMKLHAVGLRGAIDLSPSELSGGMARRVALARAVILDPQLILYDEPFTGLDPIAMGVIVKLIRQLNNALGLTSVVVSHDVPEVSSIADYIYVIADGKVIGQGTPAEIQKDDSPRLRQFIHGLPDGVVPFHYPAQAYDEDLIT